jgi:hypothetical protein
MSPTSAQKEGGRRDFVALHTYQEGGEDGAEPTPEEVEVNESQ